MANYYRSNRTQRGRFARRSIDWTKITNDALNISLGMTISYAFLNCVLKAHGL